jgi:hypothetical protein
VVVSAAGVSAEVISFAVSESLPFGVIANAVVQGRHIAIKTIIGIRDNVRDIFLLGNYRTELDSILVPERESA